MCIAAHECFFLFLFFFFQDEKNSQTNKWKAESLTKNETRWNWIKVSSSPYKCSEMCVKKEIFQERKSIICTILLINRAAFFSLLCFYSLTDGERLLMIVATTATATETVSINGRRYIFTVEWLKKNIKSPSIQRPLHMLHAHTHKRATQ